MTRHGWGRHGDWWSGWPGPGGGLGGHGHGPWPGPGHGSGHGAAPPWLGALGFGPPGFTRGPKARRGDVRGAILSVLTEQPMNGYQIIQQITQRSGGAWKPSPGSVYPTLQQLEDEGLVRAHEDAGRRLMELTDEGREYVEQNADEIAGTWRAFDDSGEPDSSDLRPLIGQVLAAFGQVVFQGSAEQRAQAAEILAETRRKLYGLLAEGDPG